MVNLRLVLLAVFVNLACGSAQRSGAGNGTVDPPPSAATSPCAARCTGANVTECVVACLIEHCADGRAVCPPARCTETSAGVWTCEPACAEDSTTRYVPLDPTQDCMTGSEVEIGASTDHTSMTDDCSNVARYGFRCVGGAR